MAGPVTDRGETLVEVIVALLLLTVGAFALAAGIMRAEMDRRRAIDSALALVAGESWLERWRMGAAGASIGEGSDPVEWGVRRGVVEWIVERPGPCLREARVRAVVGPDGATVILVSRRFEPGEVGCGG